MDIIAGIGAATEGLKLVNELRKIDKDLDKAELKLRLVDLADKLLDAKQALQDAHENDLKRKREIAALTAKLKQRAEMKDANGLLYEVDGSGTNVGEPYCNLCFAREDKLIRMRFFPATTSYGNRYRCDNCKTLVETGPRNEVYTAPRIPWIE